MDVIYKHGPSNGHSLAPTPLEVAVASDIRDSCHGPAIPPQYFPPGLVTRVYLQPAIVKPQGLDLRAESSPQVPRQMVPPRLFGQISALVPGTLYLIALGLGGNGVRGNGLREVAAVGSPHTVVAL